MTIRSSNTPVNEYRHIWVCETCTFENEQRSGSNQDERCHACNTVRVRVQRTRPTLAQQRGLVEPLPAKLSREEWVACETQALERGDASHPCSICREPFGIQENVILSCSHMFHLTCIQSFERFIRTTKRVCPLCRKENYQKKATPKAAVIHRQHCARLIQRIYRGFSTRKFVKSLWNEFYRQGKGDPMRRRRFFASRVAETTDRLVSMMRTQDDSIDALLNEFDRTIHLSRRMFDDSEPQTDAGMKQSNGIDWNSIYEKV